MPDVLINNPLVCVRVFTQSSLMSIFAITDCDLSKREQIQQKFIMNLLYSRQYANI